MGKDLYEERFSDDTDTVFCKSLDNNRFLAQENQCICRQRTTVLANSGIKCLRRRQIFFYTQNSGLTVFRFSLQMW